MPSLSYGFNRSSSLIPNKTSVLAAISTKIEKFDSWHYRLRHPAHSRLDLIGINDVPKFANKPCSICPMAKMHKLPFSISHHKSKNNFDLIHCDIWGSCSETSYDGSRYFLSIVDDFSRCTWVYMLKNKSDATTALQGFCGLINTQFQSQIKIIRTNNAEEFEMKKYYHKRGIIHQKSCVETP